MTYRGRGEFAGADDHGEDKSMPAHLTRRLVRTGARRTAATALALAGFVLLAGASLLLAPQSQAAAAPNAIRTNGSFAHT